MPLLAGDNDHGYVSHAMNVKPGSNLPPIPIGGIDRRRELRPGKFVEHYSAIAGQREAWFRAVYCKTVICSASRIRDQSSVGVHLAMECNSPTCCRPEIFDLIFRKS